MDTRTRKLARYIEQHPGILPRALAGHFEVSPRTLRTYIASANNELGDMAHIELKRGSGYRVVIHDEAAFRCALATKSISHAFTPSDADGRVTYLLNDLLWRTEWITLDQLAELLYVSRSTVVRDIRLVEERLMEHALSLERKPYKGVRVIGPERSKRLLLAALAVNATISGSHSQHVEAIKNIIDDVLAQDGIRISSVAYHNLLVHITVAVLRIEQGSYVSMDHAQIEQIEQMPEYESAQKISRSIEELTGTPFSHEETAYVAIHLAGKQTIDDQRASNGAVISDEIWSLVGSMLEAVYQEFHFDFRSDLELKMNLARHLAPLSVRLTHHLAMQNPLLEETKRRFPLAYSMASYSSSVLARTYQTEISEEELGYLALSFALALERQKSGIPKKNILVVCASGLGSARLLEHRYRSEFSDYVNRIETCDAAAVPGWDYSDIDYVFTTVPLSVTPPVPVREVSFFLEEHDIDDLKALLTQNDEDARALACFNRNLFFPHLMASTKDEVLDTLCQAIVSAGFACTNLVEKVKEREGLFPTSIGELVAVPHAAEPTGKRTVICTGILQSPVPWDSFGHSVRLVMVVSYSEDEREQMSSIFTTISTKLLDENVLDELFADQTWENFEKAILRDPNNLHRPQTT